MSPPDFLAGMYRTRESDRAPFGEHWCGPAVLGRDFAIVARYPNVLDGDGYDVVVECAACPARFYRVRALASADSCGTVRPGFVLSTGSGMGAWCSTTAEHIAEGMVGVPTQDDS